ncbi:diacylglycerol kinase family protein [Halogeometricum sp. CBA1124]|uniref:diacylglycerol kinase family protein n=1 Tax=Halogeometricum sp. CBA1124 TaxID=2668071 RepID=UPI0018D22264
MARRILVLNPRSGDGKQSHRARRLAVERGYDVRESERAGDTVDIAREAAVGEASLVAACGGDGTVNEVVRGVDEAGRLAETTLGIVPTGTGNDFADNLGVRGVAHAFEVLESGRERSLDLGSVRWTAAASSAGLSDAPRRPFVNSCVFGLTAEASARTTREAKRRLGVVATSSRRFRGSGRSRDCGWRCGPVPGTTRCGPATR